MTNKFRGEITLGNGMVMVMDYNALVELESIFNKGLPVYQWTSANVLLSRLDKPEDMTISEQRNFYFACLKRHQPEISLEDAGDILCEYPEALLEVLMAAIPALKEGGGPKNVKPRATAKK